MERLESTEYRIRRAEEIYNRRRENQLKSGMAKVSINDKKDIRLFKKMIIQILICLTIYSVFYLVKNNNYVFTEDFINKSKEILSYDINFQELYSKCIQLLKMQGFIKEDEIETQDNNDETTEENVEKVTEENKEETTEDNGIGGAQEENEEKNEISQMEQDALDIKKSISFINPIDGTITSKFGTRSPTTSTVPKFHTGLDIANKTGTPIHSSTDGDVVLASHEGDYRKPFKNSNR